MRLLKDEVKKLPDADKVIASFRKHWIKPLQKNTNKQFSFLNDLTEEQKQEVNTSLRQMQAILKDLFYLQMVNDKLTSLAHWGVELEIASFSGDHKKLAYIIRLLLRDQHSSLHSIIRDVNSSALQVEMLEDLYHKVLERLQVDLALEHHVALLDGKHHKLIKELAALSAQQKKTASLVGRAVVKKLRLLKRNKKYKKLF